MSLVSRERWPSIVDTTKYHHDYRFSPVRFTETVISIENWVRHKSTTISFFHVSKIRNGFCETGLSKQLTWRSCSHAWLNWSRTETHERASSFYFEMLSSVHHVSSRSSLFLMKIFEKDFFLFPFSFSQNIFMISEWIVGSEVGLSSPVFSGLCVCSRVKTGFQSYSTETCDPNGIYRRA